MHDGQDNTSLFIPAGATSDDILAVLPAIIAGSYDDPYMVFIPVYYGYRFYIRRALSIKPGFRFHRMSLLA